MSLYQKYLNWKNAENPAKINLKNSLRVIKAHWRKWFPLTPSHIEEQATWRLTQIKPICRNQSSCVKCGCLVSELVFDDAPCSGEPPCYPYMLSKEAWKEYKKSNNIKI